MRRALVFLLLMLMVVGCSGADNVQVAKGEQQGKKMVKVTDQRGREWEVQVPVKRLVTVPMPAASLVYAMGGGKSLVGMHPGSKSAIEASILGRIAPELAEVPTGFMGQGFAVNVEELLKLEPEVVLQWANQGEELLKPLDEVGVTTVGLNYGTQEDLEAWISLLGILLDDEKRAEGLIGWQQRWIETLKQVTNGLEGTQKPRVLYLSPVETLRTVGGDTYNQMYFEMTGAVNVAQEVSGFSEVGMEQILSWDPEILYVGNFGKAGVEEILNSSIAGQSWKTVSAVKNGRVYQMPVGGYRWDPPSQESPLTWMWLLNVQHPELVKDIDLVGEMKEFYRMYYGYDLSSDNIREILRCEVETNGELEVCGS